MFFAEFWWCSSNIRSVEMLAMLTCAKSFGCRADPRERWRRQQFGIFLMFFELQRKNQRDKKVQKLPYQSDASLENRVIVAIPTHQARRVPCATTQQPFEESQKQIFFMFEFHFRVKLRMHPMLIIVHCLKSKINFLHASFFFAFLPCDNREILSLLFSVSFPFQLQEERSWRCSDSSDGDTREREREFQLNYH